MPEHTLGFAPACFSADTLIDTNGTGKLFPYLHRRIESAAGILEDHGHVTGLAGHPFSGRQGLAATNGHRSSPVLHGRRQEPHGGQCRH